MPPDSKSRPTSTRRLGFDPKGRNGVRLSERWAEGAHTLHGVLASGFPNLLLDQPRPGWVRHELLAPALEIRPAHPRGGGVETLRRGGEHCRYRGQKYAEDEWLAVLHSVGVGGARYFQSCTPAASAQRAAGHRHPGPPGISPTPGAFWSTSGTSAVASGSRLRRRTKANEQNPQGQHSSQVGNPTLTSHASYKVRRHPVTAAGGT